MNKRKIDIKSQSKRRSALKEAGKVEINAWVNIKTKEMIVAHQKDKGYSMIGDSIDDCVVNMFEAK
jgi:hypothetical protein